MSITGAVSAEKAIHKSFELYRKLYLYQVKYNLDSVEEVFSFLEQETLAAHKKANESEVKLKEILNLPELIYYEVGRDLNAVDYFNALKAEGYPKGFLDFVNEIVSAYFRDNGLELQFREK